uniref:Uncharacterized protein n=1 Tax=Nelumbo nucifera TaxID=4432 RepID=A0A822YU19_NELNU|nr:TPA_asm: hypothetical protein HUJ06_004906 [Nelumbo nucifera]
MSILCNPLSINCLFNLSLLEMLFCPLLTSASPQTGMLLTHFNGSTKAGGPYPSNTRMSGVSCKHPK